MALYVIKETDVWEVRCIYRHSDIPNRIAQGQLKGVPLKSGRPDSRNKQPDGTVSEIYSWIDPVTNEQIAETHQYTRPDGTIGGSGQLDPKKVLWNGVLVIAYSGKDRTKRDLCNAIPDWPIGKAWARRLYGWYRRKCCMKLGPVGDAALAVRRTPQFLKILEILNLRAA